MADLPEDVLLGAWGAVGGSGAGDGVDVGYRQARGKRQARGRRTYLRHRAMSQAQGTLSWPRHAR